MRTLKIISLLVLVLVGYGYYAISSTVVSKQNFVVYRNESIQDLRAKLRISITPFLYKVAIKLYAHDSVFQSWEYNMNHDVSLKEFLSNTIRRPISKDITIQIYPGWSVFDIDKYLTGSGIIQSGALTTIAEHIPDSIYKRYPFLSWVSSLEGFLLPETYRINPSSTPEEIVEVLLSEFQKRIYDAHSFASQQDFYDALILSSIVEKEEKVSENKPVVAGILKKRNDAGELIGADATVCYAYRLAMSECTPAFIGEHVYQKTAYNTRMKTGLPPTPIANPSVETFSATVNAESSPYYYYLHDDQGLIHYGRTLEEHNANRVRYLWK